MRRAGKPQGNSTAHRPTEYPVGKAALLAAVAGFSAGRVFWKRVGCFGWRPSPLISEMFHGLSWIAGIISLLGWQGLLYHAGGILCHPTALLDLLEAKKIREEWPAGVAQ